MYNVIGVNGDVVVIDANEFDTTNDRIIFIKDGECVAWFNPDNIAGFIKGEKNE